MEINSSKATPWRLCFGFFLLKVREKREAEKERSKDREKERKERRRDRWGGVVGRGGSRRVEGGGMVWVERNEMRRRRGPGRRRKKKNI